MDCKCMAKTVGRDGFGNTAVAVRLLTRFLNRLPGEGLVGSHAWKQPVLRSFAAPPVTQRLQESRRKHDVPVLRSFTLLDTNHHALAVDIDRLQMDGFRYPQSRRIASRQNGSVIEEFHRLQKLQNFLRAEDHR